MEKEKMAVAVTFNQRLLSITEKKEKNIRRHVSQNEIIDRS